METPRKPPPPAHDILYDRCNRDAGSSSERFKKIFTQDDLLSLCSSDEGEKHTLCHINDGKTLIPLILELAGNMLFITLKSKTGGTCWGLRPREAASKVCNLSGDEKMIYTAIEESHENGIWIRNIKKRTGIADSKAMDRLVGRLQTLHLIKNVKSAKAPAQKTYMLSHLAPSDEVTGGSFYDAGDLDESLI